MMPTAPKNVERMTETVRNVIDRYARRAREVGVGTDCRHRSAGPALEEDPHAEGAESHKEKKSRREDEEPSYLNGKKIV